MTTQILKYKRSLGFGKSYFCHVELFSDDQIPRHMLEQLGPTVDNCVRHFFPPLGLMDSLRGTLGGSSGLRKAIVGKITVYLDYDVGYKGDDRKLFRNFSDRLYDAIKEVLEGNV